MTVNSSIRDGCAVNFCLAPGSTVLWEYTLCLREDAVARGSLHGDANGSTQPRLQCGPRFGRPVGHAGIVAPDGNGAPIGAEHDASVAYPVG
jgi:hypothetical protein